MTSTPKNFAPRNGTRHTRRVGRQARTVLGVITCGVFVGLALYAVTAAVMSIGFSHDGLPPPPPWLFSLASFAPPAALAVYWRPAYRVPQCLFVTGACAFWVGFVGAGFGSVVAPVVGGLTIVATVFAPKDGGWRAQWGHDDESDDANA
jgi:hypothetical protein